MLVVGVDALPAAAAKDRKAPSTPTNFRVAAWSDDDHRRVLAVLAFLQDA